MLKNFSEQYFLFIFVDFSIYLPSPSDTSFISNLDIPLSPLALTQTILKNFNFKLQLQVETNHHFFSTSIFFIYFCRFFHTLTSSTRHLLGNLKLPCLNSRSQTNTSTSNKTTTTPSTTNLTQRQYFLFIFADFSIYFTSPPDTSLATWSFIF